VSASAKCDEYSSNATVLGAGGGPERPSRVSQTFVRLLKRAGVERVRFHDLRHTAATLMLQAGVHPKVVSERPGHSTIAITLDLYSHVLPSMQREAAEALDQVLLAGRDALTARRRRVERRARRDPHRALAPDRRPPRRGRAPVVRCRWTLLALVAPGAAACARLPATPRRWVANGWQIDL
jgi:hypothetical protein